MKKTNLITFLALLTLFLVGCGNDNKNDNLNKEEVITMAQERFEDLNSVRQSTKIDLVTDMEMEQNTQTIDLEAEMIYDDDKNIEKIYTQNKTTNNDHVQTLDFYKDPAGTYSDQGGGWAEHTSGESYSSTYEPVLSSFLEIVDKMEMAEDETQYTFTYSGKDGNVFRKAGGPYSMSYQGVTEDEIELDITYWINKENMFIHQTEVQTSAQMDADNKITINAKTIFSDFNAVSDVEKPTEIDNN